MAKIKITKRVSDSVTKEIHLPDSVIERSDDRAKQFVDAGVAELIAEEKKEAVKESTKKASKKTSKK